MMLRKTLPLLLFFALGPQAIADVRTCNKADSVGCYKWVLGQEILNLVPQATTIDSTHLGQDDGGRPLATVSWGFHFNGRRKEVDQTLLKQVEADLDTIQAAFPKEVRDVACDARGIYSQEYAFVAAGGVIHYQLIMFASSDTTTVTIDHCEAP